MREEEISDLRGELSRLSAAQKEWEARLSGEELERQKAEQLLACAMASLQVPSPEQVGPAL